ncbi:hypothetical protein K501DRAFT_250157 [Backusella circina FSU 941]|nr:hypothetical protein K501DRAFT_250157 [Backusella circina FSU 941]
MKDVTRLSPKIRTGYNEEMGSIFSDTTSYSSSPLTPHQFYYPTQSTPPLSPKQLKFQQQQQQYEVDQEEEEEDSSSMHKPLHFLMSPSMDNYNSIDGESLLLKKALKSPTLLSPSKRRSFTVYNKKRRESIGDITTPRRPVSTSVIPRLTKSSIISTNDNKVRARSSLRSISQMDKDMLASIDDEESVQWDPHIDAFEILRAKITGITRSMQEFHVQELFQDELNERKKKLSERHSFASPSNSRSPHSRRFSLAAFRPIVSDVNSSSVVTPHVSQSLGHRRIKSHSYIPSDGNSNTFHHHHQQQKQQQHLLHQDSNSIKDDDVEPYHTAKRNDLTALADYRINAWSQLEEDDVHHQKEDLNHFSVDNSNDYDIDDDDDEEEEEHTLLSPSRSIASPNLTALFLTTNNLIHSRLDELSETASITSSNYNNDEEHASSLEWRQNFLGLVTACIHQSEQLESLSTDVLNTEQRVRELMILNETVSEQFSEREKQYEERIRECQDVAQQQLLMIDSLEELTADVNMKIEQLKESKKREAEDEEEDDDEDNEEEERWDFKQSVADILHLQDKSEVIQKLRWDIGMFIGGGVGTGHIIHSFQGNLNSFDMMIAGTGRTPRHEDDMLSDNDGYYYSDEESLNQHLQQQQQQQNRRVRETFSISPTISHIKFYQHHYVLHLTNKERRTRFALLPKCLWIPDNQTKQCQYQYRTVNSRKRGRQCQTQFTLFQRRHHCRRCGYIICQQHSSNKLPLFSSQSKYSGAIWSRVCDNCFRYLITQ